MIMFVLMLPPVIEKAHPWMGFQFFYLVTFDIIEEALLSITVQMYNIILIIPSQHTI